MATCISLGDLVTTREAARRLGLATGTLANQRARGEGPQFIKMGKAVRYSPRDIEDYISQNRQRTAA